MPVPMAWWTSLKSTQAMRTKVKMRAMPVKELPQTTAAREFLRSSAQALIASSSEEESTIFLSCWPVMRARSVWLAEKANLRTARDRDPSGFPWTRRRMASASSERLREMILGIRKRKNQVPANRTRRNRMAATMVHCSRSRLTKAIRSSPGAQISGRRK